MDAGDLLVCLGEVVVRGLAGEVDRDGMLTSGDVENGRRSGEEGGIGGEVGNSEGGRHDDEAEGLREEQVSFEICRCRRETTDLCALFAILPLRLP